MVFNAYNFKVAMEIAEENGMDKQLVIDCHLNLIKHPGTREFVDYIMNVNNEKAPCPEDLSCSTCPYDPICVVQNCPREPKIEQDIMYKHVSNKLENSLGGLLGSLGSGNFLDYEKDFDGENK